MNGPPLGGVQTVPPRVVTRIAGTCYDVLHDAGGNVTVTVHGDGSLGLPAGPSWIVYADASPTDGGPSEAAQPSLNRLQQAARNLVDHSRAWEVFHTLGVLGAWVQARERGIGSVDSDALAHAAVDAIHDRIRHWAAEVPDSEPS